MKQFVLDHFQSIYFASCRQDTDAGDLLIELPSGQKIAITVINRAVQFGEIKERYVKNTSRKIHTLFLMDRRMMPPDDSEVEVPGWLLALHNLTQRRIYSYGCDGRTVTVRPLHLGWNWGSDIRSVQYGTAVDTAKLMAQWVETHVGSVDGRYATANFNEGAFWKKHDPGDSRYNYYSWRNWRTSERPNPKQEYDENDEQVDPDWWEEFIHEEDFSKQRQQSEESHYQRHQQPPPQRTHADKSYYALLGVTAATPFEEVKQAYRRKALEYHPDRHPESREKYTAKMADINMAFEAISKKLKRSR